MRRPFNAVGEFTCHCKHGSPEKQKEGRAKAFQIKGCGKEPRHGNERADRQPRKEQEGEQDV